MTEREAVHHDKTTGCKQENKWERHDAETLNQAGDKWPQCDNVYDNERKLLHAVTANKCIKRSDGVLPPLLQRGGGYATT